MVVGAWFDEEGVVLSRECEEFEVCEEVDVVVRHMLSRRSQSSSGEVCLALT